MQACVNWARPVSQGLTVSGTLSRLPSLSFSQMLVPFDFRPAALEDRRADRVIIEMRHLLVDSIGREVSLRLLTADRRR